jgi:hypothetical protein
MPSQANPDDERQFRELTSALVDAIEAVLPDWVVRSVRGRLLAWSGGADPAVIERARAVGEQARAEVGAELRALLALDVDAQRANPLSVLRLAVRYPTAVLRDAGVPPVRRDEFAERSFPDDIYDLAPATFDDVDASLHEPGLVWGAAKAHIHLSRHRPDRR